LFIPINLSSKVLKGTLTCAFSRANFIKMYDQSQFMISDLQSFLQNCQKEAFAYAEKPTQFTRLRKLPFLSLIVFQFTLLKKVCRPN